MLVAQVAGAEVRQRKHAFADRLRGGRVVDVDTARGLQRVQHHGAQRLVDADVDVEARRAGVAGRK
ncbi:hypothetical protein D3C86_2225910 [compost metagenome]